MHKPTDSKPELIAISNKSRLALLPLWLASRTYNIALSGLRDKNGKSLIPLQHKTPDKSEKAGIIVVIQEDLYEQVCDIIQSAAKDPNFAFLEAIPSAAANTQVQFHDLLRQYKQVMPEAQALDTVCAVLDLDDGQAQDFLAARAA